MDDDAREQAFMSALVTEHFVLQSAAGVTVSESSSRSSLYLLTLSSSLVALGFTAASGEFGLFASVVLPVVFLIGCFTVVRLVDTSIENVLPLRRIARIRAYYRDLVPDAPTYFPTTGSATTDAQQMLGVRYRSTSLLFTMASMIGVVNAVVGGAVVGVLASTLLGADRPVAITAAAAVAVVLVVAVLAYEMARFGSALGSDEGADGR